MERTEARGVRQGGGQWIEWAVAKGDFPKRMRKQCPSQTPICRKSRREHPATALELPWMPLAHRYTIDPQVDAFQLGIHGGLLLWRPHLCRCTGRSLSEGAEQRDSQLGLCGLEAGVWSRPSNCNSRCSAPGKGTRRLLDLEPTRGLPEGCFDTQGTRTRPRRPPLSARPRCHRRYLRR